jgi:branched-chain amino acid transport system permease protein
MVLIGGVRTLFGPAIGAAIFIWLQDYFSTVWSRWPLLFGIIVVLVVIFLQGGVMEVFRLGRDLVVDRFRRVRHEPGRPAA